jgi:fumarate reductase subunit C
MSKLAFGKRNYQLMIAGLVLLVIGFTIMAMDKEPYGFGFLGLTLSPIIVLAGFITEIFAILHTPKQKD